MKILLQIIAARLFRPIIRKEISKAYDLGYTNGFKDGNITGRREAKHFGNIIGLDPERKAQVEEAIRQAEFILKGNRG